MQSVTSTATAFPNRSMRQEQCTALGREQTADERKAHKILLELKLRLGRRIWTRVYRAQTGGKGELADLGGWVFGGSYADRKTAQNK